MRTSRSLLMTKPQVRVVNHGQYCGSMPTTIRAHRQISGCSTATGIMQTGAGYGDNRAGCRRVYGVGSGGPDSHWRADAWAEHAAASRGAGLDGGGFDCRGNGVRRQAAAPFSPTAIIPKVITGRRVNERNI